MIGSLPREENPSSQGQAVTLSWIAFGIDETWVEQHIEPACEAVGERLVRSLAPERIRALVEDDQEWDILFVGGEATESDGTEIEDLVQWVSQRRPLAEVIAVMPSASLGRQLSLLRAGALDVLVLNANDTRIEQTVERAIELIQTRRRSTEQEKLRLINQLAVSVNHEINNPLTGLMGTAELLLLENKDLTEKARHDLKMILQQSRRIQEITARLKSLNHLRTVPYGSHDRMIDLAGEVPVPPREQRPAEPEAASQQFLPAPTLLVVDDNPLIIELITRLFEQNYTIGGSTSALDALQQINRKSYDLVLIDLIMPEMTGLELFREIRKIRPKQKALLTTAYQGDARVEQAIVEGASGCIYKPFQIEELDKAISDALKEK